MKKLTFEQIWIKINGDKFYHDIPQPADDEMINYIHGCMMLMVEKIADSINENIENEWIDSTVCFKLDGSIHDGKTGEQFIEWRAGDKFPCKQDKGQYISISANGKLYDIDKDSVYIVS